MDELEAVGAEFPGWHAWRGVNSLLYARYPRSSPPIVVRAHNLTVLRLRIIQRNQQLARPLTPAAPPRRSTAPGGA